MNYVEIEEASYFDRINMTKNWLEYDRKKIHTDEHSWNLTIKITPTNLNCRT